MKILVVTNLYPPHHLGGYELGCRDIVEKLRSRGHDVRVLTSTFRNQNQPGQTIETNVERSLRFTMDPVSGKSSQLHECRLLARTLEEFSPGVVYFFNQAGLCRWLPLMARIRGYPVAFYLSDTTFISWKVGAWLSRAASRNALIRGLFGRTFLVSGLSVLQKQTCHFASEFLKYVAEKNGVPLSPEHALVTHWGIEPDQFRLGERPYRPLRRLLYVGRLSPQKGVHTAIHALKLLAQDGNVPDFSLSLAGGGPDLEYAQKMRELIVTLQLGERVKVLGELPRAYLPNIYMEHDALVFPSEWDEPFAITPLEAMASGLPVIGTLTGGSGELFRNRETAMTFQAGNAADCARAIRELAGDDELRGRITKLARATVLKQHTLDVMLDAIEDSLKRIATG